MRRWHAVIETPTYLASAKGRLSATKQEEIVNALARDPYVGVVMPGGHGLRKYRHAIGGRGKSGGARVIYYVHDEHHPLLLLAVFAKNERADLSRAEVNDLGRLVQRLKQGMKRRP
jgi:mRNA-degrading endonuclease RelE of RelBE toxin-antitoxin system